MGSNKGFAPGSWTQVAVERTRPKGKVVGVDLLFCPPPKGACSVQGNFLSKGVQDQVKRLLADAELGRPITERPIYLDKVEAANDNNTKETNRSDNVTASNNINEIDESYIDRERHASAKENSGGAGPQKNSDREYNVDLVLSDMCVPLPQESGFWLNSINESYRMANTSGIEARDHAQSIDLCDAALVFAIDTLKPSGNFLCKFYTGSEDKYLEQRLKKAFQVVRREKPDASRKESKEMYFVALKKRPGITFESVFLN